MNYLENPPPFQQYDSSQTPVSNNIDWMIKSMPYNATYWEISCPYANGAIGFTWYYCFKSCVLDTRNFSAGTFISYADATGDHGSRPGHY